MNIYKFYISERYIKYIESKGFLGGSAVQNSPTMQKPQETEV